MARTITSACAVISVAVFSALAQPLASSQASSQQTAIATSAFAVASVKPSARTEWQWSSRIERSSYIASNAPAKEIVKTAYGLVIDDQLRGAPKWLYSERFDIAANADPGSSREQIRTMLQRLLAERFGLTVAHDRARLPVYALVQRSDKPLPGLKKVTDAPCCGEMGFTAESLIAINVSMPRFAALLSISSSMTGVSRLVVDRTAVDGTYQITVRFSGPPVAGLRRSQSPDLPDFFTALREQTGLALDARDEDVEVLVIKSVQHPSPN